MDLFAGLQEVLRRALVAKGVGSLTFRAGEQPLHYYRASGSGLGPPVLLVHGLGGSANGFYRLFDGLKRRFRAIYAPDLPGHGFSPLPLSGPNRLEEQMELLSRFAREVVGAPTLLVGNSLGGAMSIRLAASSPGSVVGLVLVAPAGALWSKSRLMELERAMLVRTAAEARELTRRLFHKPPLPLMLFGSELRKMYGTPAVHAAFAEARELGHIPGEILASLRAPTLVLWGKSDRLLPPESVDYFRAHLPQGSKVEVVPRFGHVPQVERPREVVQRIVRFADEHRL